MFSTTTKKTYPMTLDGLKRQARDLKRLLGCKHTHALEEVARARGFANYHQAHRMLSREVAAP